MRLTSAVSIAWYLARSGSWSGGRPLATASWARPVDCAWALICAMACCTCAGVTRMFRGPRPVVPHLEPTSQLSTCCGICDTGYCS